MHILYIPACAFSCTTGSFLHLLCLISPPLCALFSPFLAALSLLLRSFYLDVFLCINPAFFASPNFFHNFILCFFSPLPVCSISPIHTEVSFFILFCTRFFSQSLCVGGGDSFSAEVLIKRDSQFNYFYSGAHPRESSTFSLSSYIFYLVSAFLPIFLPLLFSLPHLTSLISLYCIVSLPLCSFSLHCPFMLSPQVL